MAAEARALSALFLLGMVVAAGAQGQRNTPCHDREPEEGAVRIAGRDEPGVPLVILGRVLAGSEQEPVAGARVLAFHTDARGFYSDEGMDEQNARLCGVVLSDAEGRYRFETVKPAHYATGGPPAHVHFELTTVNGTAHRFTLNFEGDPLLKGEPAGERWDRIRPLEERVDGVLVVERDFWLR